MNKELLSYIEKARMGLANKVPYSGPYSDRVLSEALGLNPTAVNQWRKRETFPSDETMFQLCYLADIDPAIGLLDLNIWRSEGNSKKTYMIMRRYMKNFAAVAAKHGKKVIEISTTACFIMVMSFASAPPALAQSETLHYGKDTVYYGISRDIQKQGAFTQEKAGLNRRMSKICSHWRSRIDTQPSSLQILRTRTPA